MKLRISTVLRQEDLHVAECFDLAALLFSQIIGAHLHQPTYNLLDSPGMRYMRHANFRNSDALENMLTMPLFS